MCKIIEAFCDIENIYPINYTCNGLINSSVKIKQNYTKIKK
jgi:hypothetical protein